MDNIYHWYNEAMVTLEMENYKREIDSIRLLHDAGLSNPGWLERAILALATRLTTLGQRLYKQYTDPNQAYEVTSSKLAV